MNKNGNDIFVGEFNVSNDKCEERYKKTSKRVEKVRTTPGSTITLQPDAFRGAMNPEEINSSSNGLVRNSREDNNQEESGSGLNNSSTITPNDRYDPSANESGEETTQIHRKRKHRKNRKSARFKRVAITFKRGGYYNMFVKFLETIPVEFHLPRKLNDVLELSEWNKRTVNFLNTHEKGSISWPVKMNARNLCKGTGD